MFHAIDLDDGKLIMSATKEENWAQYDLVEDRYIPGLTKTSYHTISVYEKLLVIQFHTIPYVQKIV